MELRESSRRRDNWERETEREAQCTGKWRETAEEIRVRTRRSSRSRCRGGAAREGGYGLGPTLSWWYADASASSRPSPPSSASLSTSGRPFGPSKADTMYSLPPLSLSDRVRANSICFTLSRVLSFCHGALILQEFCHVAFVC